MSEMSRIERQWDDAIRRASRVEMSLDCAERMQQAVRQCLDHMDRREYDQARSCIGDLLQLMVSAMEVSA